MSKNENYKLNIPATKLPRHVAIIMDGNGRWAEKRSLPRFAGHRSGVEALRNIVQMSGELGIQSLTVFAFSSENWRRPKKEVGLLMDLFMTALGREVNKLNEANVKLCVVGDQTAFPEKLQKRIQRSIELTKENTGLHLNVAANYGGKWDIAQACKKTAEQLARGEIELDDINEELLQQNLSMNDQPEPDLFIRTGGEQRISNFLIWQLAYTELYFTDALWPDFDREEYSRALEFFATRQRRFGRTGAQVLEAEQREHA